MAPDTTSIQSACTNIESTAFQCYESIPVKNNSTNSAKVETVDDSQNKIDDIQEISTKLNGDINKNIIDRQNDEDKKEKLNDKEQILPKEVFENVNKGESIEETNTDKQNNEEDTKEIYVPRIRWPDLIAQSFLHFGCLYGFYLIFTSAKWYTPIFAFFTIYTTAFGITAGAHRLWSHRAYKAKWPLKLILILLFTVTGQRDVYTWALDHRVHHKYSDSDSDPHDSRRGFFFSHVGWLFLTPHPNVVARRKSVDVRDLEADAVVMWQKRWFIPLFALLSIYLPVMIPVWFWQETIWNSFWVNFNSRFTVTLNMAFLVNSVAHMWGDRPYDKNISPVENMAVAIGALGEGWHNYHHVFPWDYKTGELESYLFNLTTAFIDFFAKVGWAYERKSVSPEMIARRAVRCGDGSYVLDHHRMEEPALWGFGDMDMPKVDVEELEKMKDKTE